MKVFFLVCAVFGVIFLKSLYDTRVAETRMTVRANLLNIQAYALSTYSSSEMYSDVCTDTRIGAALSAAQRAGRGDIECNNSILGWAVSVPLRGGGYFCVDFRGVDMYRENLLGIDVKC